MLSSALFLLALAVPPAAPASSELRPVAGIDQPRTRAAAQPVVAIASASPELREPFAKSRAPIVQGPRPVAPPAVLERSALREPFAAR